MPKTLRNIGLVIALLGSIASAQAPATAPATTSAVEDASASLTWPRKRELGGNTILLYQPQVESWQDNKLEARGAVSITAAGKTDAEFGVIWISARTDVDKADRLVSLEEIQVTKVSFPENKANEPLYLAQLNQVIPDAATDVPLDHLEANLAITSARKATPVPVKNEVPFIIVETRPSILILIDGEPVLRAIPDIHIMRVINTRALILLDEPSRQYYLTLFGQWVTSASPRGPWKPATTFPPVLDAVRSNLSSAGTIDLLLPNNPEGAPETLPAIYISDKPAELIQSRGEPEYTPIEGTNLLYMKNSENAVFRTVSTSENYVLLSGRWFRAASMKGPWQYVSGKELPPDFAKIPPDHARANVLVSVPGTPQANEAIVANAIPQTATVTISDAKLEVKYDGAPQFQDISGAAAMQFATNSALPVIFVKETKTYYCVNNGVWFYATTPQGPWLVATTVPPVIYTIPVNSPIHYVTYVRIYGSTPQVVYVGYTPGYMGTCVADDGVVVYGTGYYYPAYVGDYWVGYTPTYGYGASFACGVSTGFAFGFAAGAIIGDCWSHPYWGPCYGFGSVDINTRSVYRNWRGGVTSVSRSFEYDGWSGKSTGQAIGASFNPYTGRASVGGYATYLDRSDGNFDVKRAGATYNPRSGTITAGGSRATGNINDGNVDINRGGVRYNTQTNTGVGYANGDFYASHDGNVYRRTDAGWQSHANGGWQDAQGFNNAGFAQQRQALEAQQAARAAGAARFQGVRNSGSFQRSGGGGMRGRR